MPTEMDEAVAEQIGRLRIKTAGGAASRGPLTTTVLEHRDGFAVISVLSDDAILLVLVRPQANVGQLLLELRRNRENIASLV